MTEPGEFKISEQRHIDILVRANRQLLTQMRAMKVAGDAVVAFVVNPPAEAAEAVESGRAIQVWRESCASMK